MNLITPKVLPNTILKTLNKSGYTSSYLNPYTEQFLNSIVPDVSHVLDIGAAFGSLTLEALKRKAFVTANDREERHLEILKKNIPSHLVSRLIVQKGMFPTELNFSEKSFDLILISQVLHFLTGPQISQGLQSAFKWLKPNGKIFIVVVTPYTKVLNPNFLTHYKKCKEDGAKWPGIVENLSLYCDDSEILDHNPCFMNFLDDEVLRRECQEAGFIIQDCGFFKRDDFPLNLAGGNMENMGLIGIKPSKLGE